MLSTQRWMVAVVGSLVLSWSSLGMAQAGRGSLSRRGEYQH